MAMKIDADVSEASFNADSMMMDEMAHSMFCNWVTRPIKFMAAALMLKREEFLWVFLFLVLSVSLIKIHSM